MSLQTLLVLTMYLAGGAICLYAGYRILFPKRVCPWWKDKKLPVDLNVQGLPVIVCPYCGAVLVRYDRTNFWVGDDAYCSELHFEIDCNRQLLACKEKYPNVYKDFTVEEVKQKVLESAKEKT